MLEDENRSLLRRKPAEPTLQLVAVGDGELWISGAVIGVEHVERPTPAPLGARLRVAGVHEHAIRPGLEAGRVAEPWKLTPDGDDRLLGGIFGKVDVAQDPVRNGEEPVPDGVRHVSEGVLVASLRPRHQLVLHLVHLVGGALGDAAHPYESDGLASGSIFAPGAAIRAAGA
jgi:hypothetical protein